MLKLLNTRIHSSGMRIARLLTASQHALGGGGCIPACTGQGVCVSQYALGRRRCLPGGVCPGGGVCPRRMWQTPPQDQRQTPPPPWTDTCENITFANFVCGAVKIIYRYVFPKNDVHLILPQIPNRTAPSSPNHSRFKQQVAGANFPKIIQFWFPAIFSKIQKISE